MQLQIDVDQPKVGKLHLVTNLATFLDNVYMIPVERKSIFNKLKAGRLYPFGLLHPGEWSVALYSSCYIVKLYMQHDCISTNKRKGKPMCFVIDVDTLLTWVQQEKS